MAESPPPSPLKPRKKPVQGRSEQTVAALIEAAAQVLEAAGLEGYNTNAVAQRAGVSVGSLYQYFPSKDALTVALMQRESTSFFKEGERALLDSCGRDAVQRYIEAAVRQQLARPRLARLLDIEESRTDLQAGIKDVGSFRSLLVKVLEGPGLPPQRRTAVAVSDLLSIVRALTDAAGERGETDLEDLAARIGVAVFGYLEGLSRLDNASSSATVSGKSN
jgi:AcrR family transcriptional regulator